MDFARHLADLIRHDGPLRLDRLMALANAHYYATRDPLGAAGDFTTAPEISQLFGELLGLCLIDHWERSGAPAPIRLVELGPGRGTLMADLLRAARIRPAFLDAARITLVETSPALRRRQRETLSTHAARIAWADTLDDIPNDAPLYLIANEFFDALPIRQFVRLNGAWHERFAALNDDDQLVFAAHPAAEPLRHGSPDRPFGPSEDDKTSSDAVILRPRSGPGDPCLSPSGPAVENAILETNDAAFDIAAEIGARLTQQGGFALILDYGHARTAFGDTFQAVKSHAFADPLQAAGEADLTAHVDFQALATASNAIVHGPVDQGPFLRALGIEARAAALASARPDQAETLAAAMHRLTASGQMGTLFKAMALTGPVGPVPAGFG